MSPELKARLTDISTAAKRAADAIAQYDKSESEVDDMTFGDVKIHFEGLARKVKDMDRIVAMLDATILENWS